MDLTLIVASKIKEAIEGVEHIPGTGAACPWCGEKVRIYRTMPWEADRRVRYCQCDNDQCPLAVIEQRIKSIQYQDRAESLQNGPESDDSPL